MKCDPGKATMSGEKEILRPRLRGMVLLCIISHVQGLGGTPWGPFL